MTYRGRVKNGTILLDQPAALPDGTEVTVRPLKPRAEKSPTAKRPRPLRRGLMKFAGKAKGLPADAARNLDHYLYGHPKE